MYDGYIHSSLITGSQRQGLRVGYIHSYGPRPPGRIPAMLMKKFLQHVTSAGFCLEFGWGKGLRFIPFINGVAPCHSVNTLWLMRPVYNWCLIPNGSRKTKQKLRQAKEGHPPVRKRAYFRWLILVHALELCGTGKHPNINVETQIPLELKSN